MLWKTEEIKYFNLTGYLWLIKNNCLVTISYHFMQSNDFTFCVMLVLEDKSYLLNDKCHRTSKDIWLHCPTRANRQIQKCCVMTQNVLFPCMFYLVTKNLAIIFLIWTINNYKEFYVKTKYLNETRVTAICFCIACVAIFGVIGQVFLGRSVYSSK